MPYRFVHTADIHLDSPLETLALRDQELAEVIGNATRTALVRTVDLCIEEQVDALLIVGDLYDGDQTSMKTALFLAEQLRRLDRAGIEIFIVRGNHDAESKITQELVFPDRVKVFKGAAGMELAQRREGKIPVAIHGLSFAKPHAPDSLLKKYKSPVDGVINIAMMHTSLAGSPGHNLYAPCKPEELHTAGFHYWALGHIHKRSVLEGKSVIVMPGNPQGRDISESGPKSVSLVTIGRDRRIVVEERHTAIAQFERVRVDASGITEWPDLVRRIEKSIEDAYQMIQAEHLVARLTITGSTPLAWRMRRDREVLNAEVKHRASSIGNCWVEKIEIECGLSVAPKLSNSEDSTDPVLELRALIEREVLDSETFRLQLSEVLADLNGHLPSECRDSFGRDQEEAQALLAKMARDGAEDVLARISAERAK